MMSKLRLTIGRKIVLIGGVVLGGLLTLGGIGLWASTHLIESAAKTLKIEEDARLVEGLHRQLINLRLNASQLLLHPQQGAEEIAALTRRTQELATASGTLHQVAGSPEELTLAKQVQGNIEDLAMFFELDMAELFQGDLQSEAFAAEVAKTDASIDLFYSFSIRTMEKMVEILNAQLVAANQELQTSSAQAQQGLWITFALTLLILLPVLALFYFSLVRPLKKTVQMAQELKQGHVGSRLELGRQRDEFGDMARALNEFADALEHEVADGLQKIARGDLTVVVHPFDQQDVVRTAMKRLSEDLTRDLQQLQQSGQEIAGGARQVAESGARLSNGATQQASALEQIAATMQQLSTQTRLNAENADQARAVASQSCNAAGEGSRRMAQMMTAMEEINRSGQNISRIIKVIDEIAFQTNLLALNAAVEAARAGIHGKGFAVVAEEVRNLAARSATAARETATLIEESVQKAGSGMQIAKLTAEGLSGVAAGITKVSDLVGDIAAASREQAEGIGQVNQGLQHIGEVTQSTTATSEESAAAAQQLAAQAAQLRQMLGRFVLPEDGAASRPQSSRFAAGNAPATKAQPQIGHGWGKPAQSLASTNWAELPNK
ncbi:MAG: methyl-accepting chemotaxis protein [Trichloromonadaceae bacterium]